jgi:hypothetical protein
MPCDVLPYAYVVLISPMILILLADQITMMMMMMISASGMLATCIDDPCNMKPQIALWPYLQFDI